MQPTHGRPPRGPCQRDAVGVNDGAWTPPSASPSARRSPPRRRATTSIRACLPPSPPKRPAAPAPTPAATSSATAATATALFQIDDRWHAFAAHPRRDGSGPERRLRRRACSASNLDRYGGDVGRRSRPTTPVRRRQPGPDDRLGRRQAGRLRRLGPAALRPARRRPPALRPRPPRAGRPDVDALGGRRAASGASATVNAAPAPGRSSSAARAPCAARRSCRSTCRSTSRSPQADGNGPRPRALGSERDDDATT